MLEHSKPRNNNYNKIYNTKIKVQETENSNKDQITKQETTQLIPRLLV